MNKILTNGIIVLMAIFVLSVGILIGVNIKNTILIENSVLEERLEDQLNKDKYIEQIVDDMELVMELQQYYYQENITSHSFGDWLQINYPSLYRRLESYF